MTVKQTLIRLYQEAQSGILPEGEVWTMMQKEYPGEYIIEMYYDQRRMCFCYRPHFEDPKKEMLWRIKHGY